MGRTNACRLRAFSAAAALSLAACGGTPEPPAQSAAQTKPAQTKPAQAAQPSLEPAPPPPGQPVNPDARALEAMLLRIQDYVALHKKLEATLPNLSKESTPEEIDRHQRAMARLMQETRRGAKPGDIFTPDSQVVIKRLLARVFGGADGAALRASIMDENPGPVKFAVNGRYPDSVPLSTVPPQVLEGLPKLPDEMEFRFIGNHLILMDVHAHIIVDLIQNALPS
jgi:hypothetical protein